MGDTKKLTDEQYQALKTYAEWQGPEWKQDLSFDWMRAGTDKWHSKETYHLLQQVRNRFGPKWLASFEFSEEIQYRDY